MRYLLAVLMLAVFAVAAEKRSVKVEVLAGNSSTAYAGSMSTATTNQYGNTATGMALGVPIPIQSADMNARIEGHDAILHCDTATMWHCYQLRPGIYDAEVKGNTAWIATYNWDHSQKRVIKYKIR